MIRVRRFPDDAGPPGGAAATLAIAVLLAAGTAAHAAFTDVTVTHTGTPVWGVTFGLAWGDFDVDGDPDAFVCRHFDRPVIFRNHGDGTLSYPVFPPLFDAPVDHHGPLVADLDEDGDPDVYLTAGADAGFGDSLKRLYRNDGLDVDGRLTFVDVAAECGVTDLLARGRSSSGMDVEGDGDVDIFVAKASRVASPNSLFLNDGAMHFTDGAASAGLADDFGCVGGLWADYDGDGDPDLLIGGEEEVFFETRLYRNEGNLTFTDVTASVLPGLGQIAAASWGDADNDGDLDLAVGLGDRALFDAVTWTPDSLRYFFNTRYQDNGLDGFGFLQTGDSATYNISQDGFFQSDRIFIAAEGWHPFLSPFTLPFEIFNAPFFMPGETLATYIWSDSLFGAWHLRCNAPPEAGHAFAGIITTNGEFTAVGPVGLEPYQIPGPRGTRLWRNDGGVFTDVSAAAGLGDAVNVHVLEWVDVDQDGWLDLYVENKGDTQVLNAPNVFYRNLQGTAFADETAAWNLQGPVGGGLGDAFAWEDFDDDGDLDVMLTSGAGPRALALLERVRLLRNDGVAGNRLRVDLEGVLSTRDGYGATVTCVSAGAKRQVRYVTGNTWRGNPTMLDPYFGLGTDAFADSLIVAWPSGVVDVFTNVPAGRVTVTESDPTFVVGPGAAATGTPLRLDAQPNPASGGAVLFAAGRRAGEPARLLLRDAAGRRVLDRVLAPGEDRVAWDGRDARGRPAAAGVYFARLTEGARSTGTKLVFLGR